MGENMRNKLVNTKHNIVLHNAQDLEDISENAREVNVDDPRPPTTNAVDEHLTKIKSELDDSETVILNDLSTNEWSVLSGNHGILPLEQDLRGEVGEDTEHKHLNKYIKVNCD